MDKQELNQRLEKLQLDNQIAIDDIPDIDLYMDQVTQLFEKAYSGSKRNPDDKVLTKTMINNYAKGKLLPPIKNKKYSKDHIMLINLIYQLKGTLSISDIKSMLEQTQSGEKVPLEDLYSTFNEFMETSSTYFKEHVKKLNEDVQASSDSDGDATMDQLLLIGVLSHLSNLYRRLAEQIVDDMSKGQE
ncbi:DUF1836 domain-containing protein [Radiobacillus kanasensis]|uniref:DUF1836 domain-containing protein n=1 Tax=Radiobacillus kanasensis TaxID=2844358 RepID=UPI001E3CC215|nr:DUF1836 domain-containing protein [Radiobacillus kanasensis]UFU00700.1 DUF1836 domain-containing protein [Radiobacillus kanasensis]